jgi:RNA polymerase sigma-70 factor (ECF subfamily)
MDKAEIKALYEQYGYAIYGRCMRILQDRDDARDAMQAVFLKLIEQEHLINDKEKIVPWIFTVATNYCFNSLRYSKKFNRNVEPDDFGTDDSSEKRQENCQLIGMLMNTQDRKTREAVYYTYVEELEQSEIQKVTGQSPATIRRRLARFKEYCRKSRKRLEIS